MSYIKMKLDWLEQMKTASQLSEEDHLYFKGYLKAILDIMQEFCELPHLQTSIDGLNYFVYFDRKFAVKVDDCGQSMYCYEVDKDFNPINDIIYGGSHYSCFPIEDFIFQINKDIVKNY